MCIVQELITGGDMSQFVGKGRKRPSESEIARWSF